MSLTPTILIGTDFSDGSLAAFEAATIIAGADRVATRLMHVFAPGRPEQLDLDASQWLERAGVTADWIGFRNGNAAVELARAARVLDAGLIVVGANGRSGRQSLRLGSTASRLSLIAPCPVVVVNGLGRPVAENDVHLPRPIVISEGRGVS